MNALLLTALTGSGLSESGALLNKKSGTSAFADLLEQQTDLLDPEFLLSMPSLNLDPAAKNALLEQLKQAGISPQLIQELEHKLSNDFAQKTVAVGDSVLLESPVAADTNDSAKALAFIHSTLHIARESQALRHADPLGAPIAALNTTRTAGLNPTERSARPVLTPLVPTDKHTVVSDSTNLHKIAPNTVSSSAELRVGAATQNTDTLPPHTSLATTLIPEKNQAQPTLSSVANLEPVLLSSTPSNLTTNTLPFSSVVSTQITTPVQQSQQWGQDFSRILVQMSQQSSQTPGLQSAEIRLDPPELGPLRIVLSVNDSVANAMIFAAHAQTRLTVEQALPQLQQQLNQAGLTLGEANVSDQGFSAHTEQHTNGKANSQATLSLNQATQSNDDADLLGSDATTKRVAPDAIIDTFA